MIMTKQGEIDDLQNKYDKVLSESGQAQPKYDNAN